MDDTPLITSEIRYHDKRILQHHAKVQSLSPLRIHSTPVGSTTHTCPNHPSRRHRRHHSLGWVERLASGWSGTGVVQGWYGWKISMDILNLLFVFRVCHIIVRQAANYTLSIYELPILL